MAKNVMAAGVYLIVSDQRQDVSAEYVKLGARAAKSPADLASQVSKLFMCLPFTPEVDVALFGPGGVTEGAEKGLMIVDTSTIYVGDAVDFQTRLSALDIIYSDCPISGMPFRAKDGTLTMMFGGQKEHFEQAKPYLEMMGAFILHCGDCGKGQMMKAFNNVVYDINIAAISELLPTAVKAGLDPSLLEQLFTTGSSRSFASEHFVPRMVQRSSPVITRCRGPIKTSSTSSRRRQIFQMKLQCLMPWLRFMKKPWIWGLVRNQKALCLKSSRKILVYLYQRQMRKNEFG